MWQDILSESILTALELQGKEPLRILADPAEVFDFNLTKFHISSYLRAG
jgi:hypothetical protein